MSSQLSVLAGVNCLGTSILWRQGWCFVAADPSGGPSFLMVDDTAGTQVFDGRVASDYATLVGQVVIELSKDPTMSAAGLAAAVASRTLASALAECEVA